MGQIFLKNADFIVTMDKEKKVFRQGDILIEDDKILSVGKVEQDSVKPNAEIIDATGKIIMPGLVNTHVHLTQQLVR